MSERSKHAKTSNWTRHRPHSRLIVMTVSYNENDGGRVLSGESEDVAHHSRSFSQVLLHELRADDADERSGRVVSNGLRHHRLA